MTVDLTLTKEQALDEIGELLSHDYPENRLLRSNYPGIEQTIVEGVIDTSFTIHEESGIMQNLKRWRESQIRHGFVSSEAIDEYRAFSSALKIGIFGDYDHWEYKQGWRPMELFYESDHISGAATVHFEVLYNALEHGSKFGAKGPVTARFRGGKYGALIEITDPGKGRLTVPLTIDQMVERLQRTGRTMQTPPASFQDFVYPKFTSESSYLPLARGMGAINATVGKPVVSECQTEEGYTVLLLYKPSLMPDYWKLELLQDLKKRHYLTEDNKRLLRE